jgi:hypothetical protein
MLYVSGTRFFTIQQSTKAAAYRRRRSSGHDIMVRGDREEKKVVKGTRRHGGR